MAYEPTFAPGAMDAESEDLRRRYALAQELKKPLSNPQGGQMVGNYFVANPWQVMADVYNFKKGREQEDALMQEAKDLQATRQQQMAEQLSNFRRAYEGAPEQQFAGPAPQGAMQDGGYTQAAVKGNPMGAFAQLAESQFPQFQQAGFKGMIELPQIQMQEKAKADAIARQEAADRERERHNRAMEANTIAAINNRGVEKLKPIPLSANQAILGNDQSLKQLNDTIASLEANPEAVGWKGYMPNAILNRVNPEGTETRAGIADIGSLKLHERSGAAVTASESPRLMPFIPLATDDKATALKKLTRLRDIVSSEQQGLSEIYGSDQGYKPNPIAGRNAVPAPQASTQRQVVKTGTVNGRKVVQYSDGSTAYAD